jgi:hypothetical protein
MSFPVGNAKSQLRHLYNWDRIPNIVPASVFWHVSVRSGMYDDLPKCGNRMTAAKSSGLRLLDAYIHDRYRLIENLGIWQRRSP